MTRKGNESGHELEQNPEITYNPGFADSGNAPERDPLLQPGTSQDLSRPAKTTLGNYLSALSRGQVNRGAGQPNSFQIPGDSQDTQGSAMTVNPNMSSRTNPSVAKSEMQSAGSTLGSFLDLSRGYGSGAAEKFDDTKNSEYVKNDNPFKETDIKRIGSDERRKSFDGNSLLVNIKSTTNIKSVDLGNPDIGQVPEDAPVVQKRISDVLRQNRFNPIEKAFVQNHERQNSGYTIQRQSGKYDASSTASIVDEEKLKQVGLQLMIRATGHGISGVDLLDLGNDQTAMNNLAPLVPTLAQFTGLPVIDTVNLRAGNVPVAQDIVGADSKRTDYINPDGLGFNPLAGKSYGVLNSHLEPFDGALPIGTLTTTVAGIIGILGFSALVSKLPMLLESKDTSLQYDPSNPINLRKGRRGMVTDDVQAEFYLELFGIPKTDHSWEECLFAGVGAFFGIGDLATGTGITAETILEKAFNIAMAPGYYAVVIRNAIRDTEQIIKSVADFAEGISQTNIVLSISNFFKMIESITTSATYRFITAMIRLGNQVLNYGTDFVLGGGPDVDSMLYNASNRHMKSRIVSSDSNIVEIDLGSTQPNALAWKHSAAQSRYLLPKSFIDSHSIFKQTDTTLAGHDWKRLAFTPGLQNSAPKLPDGKNSKVNSSNSNSNRIPSEYVKEVEDGLEVEYMPFYFHDLRTNEIISFHAFLSDLSDGFTASYNNTSGYGRIEDVMIYNNTKRSISFTFYVAATSEQDHSVMYWNINKIVSMLYPQYSRGRTMVNGVDKFIQPFSQIPTASPMIRLRIGDVVKSNYSKFGIARLFGLGQDESAFNMDRERVEEKTVTPAVPGNLTEARADVTREVALRSLDGIYLPEDIVYLSPGQNYAKRNSDGFTARQARDTSVAGQSSRHAARYRSNVEAIVKRVLPDITSYRPRAAAGSTTAPATAPRSVRRQRPIHTYLVKLLAPSSEVSTYSYHIVRSSQIAGIAPRYIDDLVARRAVGTPASTTTSTVAGAKDPKALSNFLSPESNPIIKSFESSRGRGLAGFITDLKMDWAESPWDVRPGSRAPMFMKLSISFSPIHDIPMGLDSDGMMRSVAYNVGEHAGSIGHDPYDGGVDRSSFETLGSKGSGEASDLNDSGDSLDAAAGG